MTAKNGLDQEKVQDLCSIDRHRPLFSPIGDLVREHLPA